MVDNVDFISNPKKAFWQFSTPLLLLTLFEAGYSFVDVFWVSQMNAESFFAIGVSVPLVTLIMSLGRSLGIGTNSIMSRELGGNDLLGTYNSILHGIVACFVIGFGVMFSIFFLKHILIYIGAASSMDLSMKYLTPIFLWSFVFIFSNFFANTLQAEGNSKIPTVLLILTNVLNLILDPIFIFVFGWGVSGAAYATVLSSGVGAVYLLYWYLSGRSEIPIKFKYFKPGIVYDIFLVALPNFLTDSLWCITILFFNKILIGQLGQIGILLYSTATRIELVLLSPQKAFSRGLVSVCGHLYGAKKIEELKDLYNYVIKITVLVSVIIAVIFFFIRDYGFALFSVSGVSQSVFYIALAGIVIVGVHGISLISEKMLDGMGKTFYELILTIGIIIYEISIVNILAPIFKQGVCVLLGVLIGEVTFAIAYYILLKYFLKKSENDVVQSV